jgi:hypothetical protein
MKPIRTGTRRHMVAAASRDIPAAAAKPNVTGALWRHRLPQRFGRGYCPTVASRLSAQLVDCVASRHLKMKVSVQRA